MSSTPTLYTQEESGNCYKVRLLAAILGIEVKEIEIDFKNDHQHTPEFLAISPRGEIPVLVDGDRTLTDSASILVYLAGKKPESGFWSQDVGEQAEIVEWLAFAASWAQFGVFTARAIIYFKGTFNGLGLETNENTLREARIRGHKSLEILEKALGSREWLANKRPTIADIAVFIYVALAPMGGIELEPYPAVLSWIARTRKLPGFIPTNGLP